MKIGNNPLCRNLARLLDYRGHYSREGDFKKNLRRIDKELKHKQPTVYRWISGEENPMLANLIDLCNMFGWDLYELFIDYEKYINFQSFKPEHKKILRMLATVENEHILNGIMQGIEIGLIANGKMPK